MGLRVAKYKKWGEVGLISSNRDNFSDGALAKIWTYQWIVAMGRFRVRERKGKRES